ncbi:ATP-dependent RNA helicase [Bacillus phage vB_BsuM-Goe16]|nr:ATP-dependent RNA helicase [Bacillus phage vB_BsuM-Goe16]
MAIIELGNVHSTIKEASKELMHRLNEALAVETPGFSFSSTYNRGFWDGKTRFLNKKTGQFPTGLLSYVAKTLKRHGEEYEIVDNRTPVGYSLDKEITLSHKKLGQITLRDYQYESVEKGLASSRGIINVATNGGKTEIACGIIKSILPHLKKGQRIAFFTHSTEIFNQSAKRLSERLQIKVGKIGAGTWDEQQVTVVMIPTIQKYYKKPKKPTATKKLKDLQAESKRLKDLSLRDKSYKGEYKNAQEAVKEYTKQQMEKLNDGYNKGKGFLDSLVGFIADEAHHSSSDTWYNIFMSLENCYFRYGLTGTVDESNEINLFRLYGCTGKIVKKVTNKFLIENGYSAKPVVYFLPIETKSIDYVDYQTARDQGIINNKERNQAFVDKVLERAKSGKQCLIIVNETTHGEIILNMLSDQGITVDFTHGEMTKTHRQGVLDRLDEGSLDVLIATSILDEGVDVSGINCLFLMAGGKSMRQMLQRIGRGLRKKEDGSGLEVYDALDYHNEFLVDHTAERYQTYKNEEFEVKKL